VNRNVYLLRFSCLVLVFVIGVTSFWLAGLRYDVDDLMKVRFLAVGQGDAIFIETPSGKQVLIDGGNGSVVLTALRKYMTWYDRGIDLVVSTHPDLDHIGGLVEVLPRFEVDSILLTEATQSEGEGQFFYALALEEGADIIFARTGQEIWLESDIVLKVLSPAYDPSLLETNAGSIVTLLQYKDVGFMLTGDAPFAIEDYLVESGEDVEAQVLKLGHHGSKTSTGEKFLAAVNPAYTVVSAGANNTYGHPHEVIVDRVQNFGATILSTAFGEDISFVSDGLSVWRKR
tara:strand:+ start:9728 stop:10588 length:861 start_codon:yes stop_codon:yes gene_type:complete